jgi:hypothetical protein
MSELRQDVSNADITCRSLAEMLAYQLGVFAKDAKGQGIGKMRLYSST